MSNMVYGNYYDKHSSRNPLTRFLMDGFRKNWLELFAEVKGWSPEWRILEVGCGDGQFLRWYTDSLKHEGMVVGLDPGLDVLAAGRGMTGLESMINGSIYELPFCDNEFEIVVVPEVFEHLENPGVGLDEVARVASRYVVASVPWEPMWRIANMMRGAYLGDLGNTPGHIQHFSRRGFISFMESRLSIRSVRTPFPWTQVIGEIKP